eukprot:Selendium_serpulae@DN5050_c0_g1_i2.p1
MSSPKSDDNQANKQSQQKDQQQESPPKAGFSSSSFRGRAPPIGSGSRSSPFNTFRESSPDSNSTCNGDLPAQWPAQLDAIEFERGDGRHRSHPAIAMIPEDRVDLDMDSVLTPRGPIDEAASLASHSVSRGGLGGIDHDHKMRSVPENHPSESGNNLLLNLSANKPHLHESPRLMSPSGRWPPPDNRIESGTSIFVGSDDAVQSTTYDAAASKHSATVLGYYEDPYCQYFVKRPIKRSPLINRGYYARVAGVRHVIKKFFETVPSSSPIQVVNLGSGLDTTFFWLNDWVSSKFPQRQWQMFEVDFPEVTQKKKKIIMGTEVLWKKLANSIGEITTSGDGTFLKSPKLQMLAVDIRRIEDMNEGLAASGFQSDIPTLFLCECVLVYMQSLHSNLVIRWAANAVKAPSAMVTYEQMNPHDAFGRTMVKNLEIRGCPLLGIYDYPTLESQRQRYVDLGWHVTEAVDMNDVYDVYIDRMDVMRVQRLELFDEIEEWRLIQGHYFISVAIKGLSNAKVTVEDESRNAVADLSFLKPLRAVWTGHAKDEMPRFTTEEIRRKSRTAPEDLSL